MSGTHIRLTLNIWRQNGPSQKGADAGRFVKYERSQVSVDSSFLEMLDELNEEILVKGEDPVAFDHDCREGICGTCGMIINGMAHGPRALTTTCQLHMREFRDGDELWIEPWRAASFPVIKDLAVDRRAFDTIIQAGGFISVNTGGARDANEIPIAKPVADMAMDAAQCIGCGACVAACPNASAMLFTAAKVGHLNALPQGQPERFQRARNMVETMENMGFGGCTNHNECEAACPKGISTAFIARLNRDYLKAVVLSTHA
jgi:succinate dehydrogenase / fumarate reductase iron-sulfur subunit